MLNLNTPNCLDNYIISLNGCYPEDTVPTSGYYLENLEGLTINNVAAVSNEALVSATATVREKMYFAADIVEKRLKDVLNARGIKLNSIGSLYSVCQVNNVSDIRIVDLHDNHPCATVLSLYHALCSTVQGFVVVLVSHLYFAQVQCLVESCIS